jgi:glycosyltransferase involved in cell wall biosynthesis
MSYDIINALPKVTVIALCFNHERFVIECLDSIERQSYKNLEIIIIDDCSSDQSVHLIKNWITTREIDCVFFSHEINMGVCRSLNQALSNSDGEYVCMIATDDMWLPNKVECQMERMLAQSEKVAVVYSDTNQIDADGNLLPLSFLQMQRPGFEMPSGSVLSYLLDRNFVHPLATVIRRSAIVSVGGYDEKLVVEDYDMWLRLADRFEFVFAPCNLSLYRIVNTSLTRTLFKHPSADFSYGNYLLCEKWIVSGKLSPSQIIDWVKRQADASYWLFYHGDSRAKGALWVSFVRTKRISLLLLIISTLVGIDRVNGAKIKQFLGGFAINK